MKIDRAGVPFIAAAWVPGVALLLVEQPWWAALLLALGGFFAFFFRDPDRRSPTDPALVLAPADGRVLVAGDVEARDTPRGAWRQISIFLSPLDVHVNRSPVGGRVTQVDYRPGRFLPAYRPEATTDNERTEIWIDHGGQQVVCRQVVGVLARRIVCRVQPGVELQPGQRLGIMKFGSRIDLFVPAPAVLQVARGDTVRAGETVVAVLSADGDADDRRRE